MIIELTNYFNWKGSLLNPGQVLSDLPDGLANNLINAGNAREYNPNKQTIEVQNEPEIQSNKPKVSTPRANAKSGRGVGKPKTNRNKQV